MKYAVRYPAILLTLVVITLFAFPAFGQSEPLGKWRLTAYNWEGKLEHPLDGVEITLNINTEGKLGGKSGCNTYGGSWELDNGKLKITDIFSTKMFCGADSNLFESSYYEFLGKAAKFTIEKGKLTLTDPKSPKFMEFAEVKKPRITPMINTKTR